MRWSAGEATVERLARRWAHRAVQGAQADGASWLDRARRGLEAAQVLTEVAPDSSVVLAYDAAIPARPADRLLRPLVSPRRRSQRRQAERGGHAPGAVLILLDHSWYIYDSCHAFKCVMRVRADTRHCQHRIELHGSRKSILILS
jgi:hypothetical protein